LFLGYWLKKRDIASPPVEDNRERKILSKPFSGAPRIGEHVSLFRSNPAGYNICGDA
jgi:hypothetical protein